MRPSSRPQSSNRYNRYEDNRSSRPARPRLNRETVDRAWESGAPNQHADYRPRGNNYRGQAPRDNQRGNQRDNQHNHWRDNRQQGQQGQYSRTDRAPYGNRQGNYRRFDDAGSEQRSQSRPYNSNRRNFDDRPHSDYQSRSYGSRSNYQSRNEGERSHYRGNDRPYESRSGYRDNHREQDGYQRRGNDRYERGSRDFERSDRNNRYDSNRRPPRSFDRDNRNSRPPRNDYRDSHNKQAPRNTRDTLNPRWQSRPFAQRDRDNAYPREQFEHRFPQDEQFEGDYERFNSNDGGEQHERPAREERPMRPRRPFNTTRTPQEREPEEHHVTHMPDGRVLKGSRPQQRKAAAYWTDIAHNTDDLLDGIEAAPAKQVEQPTDEVSATEGEETLASEGAETAAPEGEVTAESKPRRRAASAVSRSRNVGKAGTKKGKSPAVGADVPRPSKRGFKWPSP